MTYKQQMQKSIKEYLARYGFKYHAKIYSYVRNVDENLIQDICYAPESGYLKQYYYLRTAATVTSKLLNEILYEVTAGLADFRDLYSSPAYLNTLDGENIIHTEFTGERSMEDNMADFDRMFKNEIRTVFEKFNSHKKIFLCAADEKIFNPYNRTYVWFYVPLAYYFKGEFDKAFEYIEERVKIEYENIARFGVNEQSERTLKTYHNYRENLKKWIAEKRQFKVDDEYLPVFK